MAEVKWIKIVTDIFDNKKIRIIESMPDGDSIIVIWFKLLMLAGNINDGGAVYFTNDIPYTEQMLSTTFNRPLNTIQLALNTFEKFGMIEIVDDIIKVSNWEKYQNVESLEKIREQTRLRVSRYRERKQIECNATCNVTVTHGNAIDIEEDKDKDRDKRIDYQQIVDMYNETCVSFPRLKTLSDARKKAIKARLKTYTIEDFQTLFTKAESSDFLKGKNDRNWSATFDWMIKDSNMAKILDGNYDKQSAKPKGNAFTERIGEKQNYNFDELERILMQ